MLALATKVPRNKSKVLAGFAALGGYPSSFLSICGKGGAGECLRKYRRKKYEYGRVWRVWVGTKVSKFFISIDGNGGGML